MRYCVLALAFAVMAGCCCAAKAPTETVDAEVQRQIDEFCQMDWPRVSEVVEKEFASSFRRLREFKEDALQMFSSGKGESREIFQFIVKRTELANQLHEMQLEFQSAIMAQNRNKVKSLASQALKLTNQIPELENEFAAYKKKQEKR